MHRCAIRQAFVRPADEAKWHLFDKERANGVNTRILTLEDAIERDLFSTMPDYQTVCDGNK